MRVLAGIYKSKKIETINNADTRPMMSKVREAIFNSIQFMVEDKDVLDLYSGSGSLGIEALSRGANYVTFVELSKECILILKKNVENMSSNLSIVNSPVNSFIQNSINKYDLIFYDPPFELDANQVDEEVLIVENILNDKVSERLIKKTVLLAQVCDAGRFSPESNQLKDNIKFDINDRRSKITKNSVLTSKVLDKSKFIELNIFKVLF